MFKRIQIRNESAMFYAYKTPLWFADSTPRQLLFK